jgi:acylphosphatase
MTARRLIIEGRVQGVGYRWWAVGEARALGLRGWVRNRRDGSVELLAIGEADALDRLAGSCAEGPPGARVDRVAVSQTEEEAPSGFEQRPTA